MTAVRVSVIVVDILGAFGADLVVAQKVNVPEVAGPSCCTGGRGRQKGAGGWAGGRSRKLSLIEISVWIGPEMHRVLKCFPKRRRGFGGFPKRASTTAERQ